MEREQLRALLNQVSEGECGIDAAIEKMAHMPFSQLDSARFDHHRSLRCGFAEVVFAPGKRSEDIVRIVKDGLRSTASILVTRVDTEQAEKLLIAYPDARHNLRARTILVGQPAPIKGPACVVVTTAGTSDIPVAEEALETLHAFGCSAEKFYDVGVAGLHRLLKVLPEVRNASVVICVAGMEGALPSVIGGLVSSPVIAVPTSVGYGASFGGVTALLAMLNTCAAGVSVVNIDNGFGAAMCALRIVRTTTESHRAKHNGAQPKAKSSSGLEMAGKQNGKHRERKT